MGQPHLINVIGLKKSGKTTVTEGIVASLRARGYRVGTVKSMVQSAFSMDTEGKDTHRHGQAGAEFTVSLSLGETVLLQRHDGGRRGIKDISHLFPEGAQYVICEGLEDPGARQLQVVCLRDPDDMERTVQVRMVDQKSVICLSGLIALKGKGDLPYPLFNVMEPSEREGLTDLIISRTGGPDPAGGPSGPIVDHGETWKPGVLPPGEFPEVPPIHNGGG